MTRGGGTPTSFGIREIRVLLVEDSPEERRLIGFDLAEIEDPRFCCSEASRLSEAEVELRKGMTDVVLLDLSLPDSTGLAGLARLCREYPSLPIVVYTGLDDQELALQALRQGGQDFLVKGQAQPSMLARVLAHAIERKRVDVALSSSHESLREAQRLETLGRLAGKIAHDFNNILNTIVGYSDVLLKDLRGNPCVEDLLEIKRAGKRGVSLTSNILAFARKEVKSAGTFILNDAVTGIWGMLGQLLPPNIALRRELQSSLPLAVGSLEQAEQAIVNLVVNARDSMPEGGTVTIRTVLHTVVDSVQGFGEAPRPGVYAAVVVEDTGSGMDSETLSRIFAPFFTTKPRGAGTGLGLSTIADIARRSGGGVEVSSTPGQGTQFVLSFAIASESDLVVGAPRAVQQSHPFLEEQSEPTAVSEGVEECDMPWGLERDEPKESLKHLYYVVSHDFHEPLRMVNSYLKLLKRRGEGALPLDFMEFLDYALEGSQRLQGMLAGVLRYSRALQAAPRCDRISAHEVYDSVIGAIPKGEIVRWDGVFPVLVASADHLSIILRELISNALKFADPISPEVSLEYRPHSVGGVFEVRDNGRGIPLGESERCFRLFGRLHSREEAPGLGVGLSIAQVLAEKYGAHLEVSEGEGGRLHLIWPSSKIVTGGWSS